MTQEMVQETVGGAARKKTIKVKGPVAWVSRTINRKSCYPSLDVFEML